MLHLALMGLLAVGVLIWAIKNRAWELSVTVEMPGEKTEKIPEVKEKQAAKRRSQNEE